MSGTGFAIISRVLSPWSRHPLSYEGAFGARHDQMPVGETRDDACWKPRLHFITESMNKTVLMNAEQWREEAFAAVHGQALWTCITASISPDGSKLYALYERRLSGIRRELVLDLDRLRSLPERSAEIQRRLGIRTAHGGGEQTA
jgi:hypothetical protein